MSKAKASHSATPTSDTVTPLRVVLITSCSASKTVAAVARGADLPKDLTMREALTAWVDLMNAHEPSVTPSTLFRGIGFNSVVKAQDYINPEDIFIMSSGTGLTPLGAKIVPYDFTTDPKHANSIHQVVTQEPFVMTVWWSLINQALWGSSKPIADQLDRDDIDLVIIGVNRRSLKLISEDIVQSAQVHKLRIVMTSKSTSILPPSLRETVLKYDRRLSANTIGNRNDLGHRAALHFIRILDKNPDYMSLSLPEHQALIMDSLGALGPPQEGRSQRGVNDLERLLMGHPDIINMPNPDAAFQRFKSVHGSSGGILAFRCAWRRVQTMDPSKTSEASKSTVNAALQALKTVEASLSTPTRGVSHLDEIEALDGIRLFAQVLQKAHPKASFTGKDICTWASAYYTSMSQELPSYFQSHHKLSFLLKTYYEDLSLEQVYAIGSGGQSYKLRSVDS